MTRRAQRQQVFHRRFAAQRPVLHVVNLDEPGMGAPRHRAFTAPHCHERVELRVVGKPRRLRRVDDQPLVIHLVHPHDGVRHGVGNAYRRLSHPIRHIGPPIRRRHDIHVRSRRAQWVLRLAAHHIHHAHKRREHGFPHRQAEAGLVSHLLQGLVDTVLFHHLREVDVVVGQFADLEGRGDLRAFQRAEVRPQPESAVLPLRNADIRGGFALSLLALTLAPRELGFKLVVAELDGQLDELGFIVVFEIRQE